MPRQSPQKLRLQRQQHIAKLTTVPKLPKYRCCPATLLATLLQQGSAELLGRFRRSRGHFAENDRCVGV